MKHGGCSAGAARHLRRQGAGRGHGQGQGRARRRSGPASFTVEGRRRPSRSRADAARTPAEPEVVLRLDGITKRFGALVANDAISLELARGEVLALLGENGAGKTTLMNILFGHYVADAGIDRGRSASRCRRASRAPLAAGIGMVHQHFTLADNLTVLDNIMLGTEPLWRLSSRPRAARAGASPTLAQRFGLAVDPDATVGEPLGRRAPARRDPEGALPRRAHPDPRRADRGADAAGDRVRCSRRCSSSSTDGLSIIFITHKLDEVMAVSDRIVVLRQGRLVAERRDRRRPTRQELAELMVGRAGPGAEARAAGARARRSSRFAECRCDGRPRPPDRRRPRRSMAARSSAIAGVSGNGQSALADLLSGPCCRPPARSRSFGEDDRSAWTPRRVVAAGVARIPEDRHAPGLIADMSVDGERRSPSAIAIAPSAAAASSTGRLPAASPRPSSRLRRECPSPGRRVRLLSGGNMQKLHPRPRAHRRPALHPRQPADPRPRHRRGRLRPCPPARGPRAPAPPILLISEDLDEILALADRVAVIYRGRLSAPLPRAAVTVASSAC